MLLKSTEQHKNTVKEKILETLILIQSLSEMSQADIYRLLGYEKDPFSQIKSGFSYGSPQLLAALLLLQEVINLRIQISANEKMDEAKTRLRSSPLKIKIKYPEQKPSQLAMNDATSQKKAEVPNASRQAELIQEGLAKLQEDYEAERGPSDQSAGGAKPPK